MTGAAQHSALGRLGGLSPRLLAALAAALALSVFAMLQPDGAQDELLAKSGADDHSARQAPAASSDRTGPRGPITVAGKKPAGLPPEQAARLIGQVRAWEARRDATPRRQATTADFTSMAWASQAPPPPPPPAARRAPVVEPPPVAPRFPYEWVGRYVDDAPRAVVIGPMGTWVLRQGEVIEGTWRLDQINDERMRVTYLPLKQSQMVAMK